MLGEHELLDEMYMNYAAGVDDSSIDSGELLEVGPKHFTLQRLGIGS